jgi:hypothetical protein
MWLQNWNIKSHQILLGWSNLGEDEVEGVCNTYGEMTNGYKISVGKPEGTSWEMLARRIILHKSYCNRVSEFDSSGSGYGSMVGSCERVN